jgi:hypothetical protein
MKAFCVAVLFIVLGSPLLLAQTDKVSLLAQSVDGKTVKLFWFIKSWSPDITGFDIKRKEGAQSWIKLNASPILPGISIKKKLSINGNNIYEESVLKAKLYKLLKARTVQETEPAKYLALLNSNENELPRISKLMTDDFDVAMLCGFGFTDHSLIKKDTYEYGLFIQGTDRLLAKVSWSYGEIPDLDVIKELTSKANIEAKGIKVIWVADMNKITAAHIVGFNIYREGIRLNTDRITAENVTDSAVFSWYDTYTNSASSTLYGIAAESIFDIEGVIRPYPYDPADHPKEYKKAAVTEVSSVGYYFKEGTSIKWDFPKAYERFIKGFYIEKNNTPKGYAQVSGLLDPTTRSFTDKSQSQVNGYIKARVTTVYKDRSDIGGTEKLFTYFPVTEPPAPENVKVSGIAGVKSYTANISWDGAMAGDSITDYYKVYAYDEVNHKFAPVSEGKIGGHILSYTIQHGTMGVHKFAIKAVSRNNVESQFSDTVLLATPSIELPAPALKMVISESTNKATISWQYPEIGDVKGFRLTQNNKVIASENELKSNAREYVTDKLEEGASYEFTICAISDRGVISEISSPFHVVVTQTSK